jgi:hypothetical protein
MSLFSRPGFPELVSWVEGVVGARLHAGWAVVHSRGGYNVVHNHGLERRLTAVYYVGVPDPPAAVFFRGDGWEMAHQPSEGELLVFPSSLDHGVEESVSDGLRVSVVCDFL